MDRLTGEDAPKNRHSSTPYVLMQPVPHGGQTFTSAKLRRLVTSQSRPQTGTHCVCVCMCTLRATIRRIHFERKNRHSSNLVVAAEHERASFAYSVHRLRVRFVFMFVNRFVGPIVVVCTLRFSLCLFSSFGPYAPLTPKRRCFVLFITKVSH